MELWCPFNQEHVQGLSVSCDTAIFKESILHLVQGKLLILRQEFPGDDIEVLCPNSRTGEGVWVIAVRIRRGPVSVYLSAIGDVQVGCLSKAWSGFSHG